MQTLCVSVSHTFWVDGSLNHLAALYQRCMRNGRRVDGDGTDERESRLAHALGHTVNKLLCSGSVFNSIVNLLHNKTP